MFSCSRFWSSVLGLCVAVQCSIAASQTLKLTESEQDWIREHGEVRVLVASDEFLVQPFYAAPRAGQPPHGFGIDVFDILAQRAGLRWRYIPVASEREAVQMWRDGLADATPLLGPTPTRSQLLSFPGSVLSLSPVFVTRKEAVDLSPRGGFTGLRIAVLVDSWGDELLQREYPGAQVQRLPSQRAAIEAVAAGRADAALTELHSAIYVIETGLMSNLQVRAIPDLPDRPFGPAVRRDLVHLHSILAKALQTLTPAERADLARRWLPAGVATTMATDVALTPIQKQWLAAHGDLNVSFDADFMPFTRQGAMGGFEGLGADLLRAAAAKVGLRIAAQQGGTLADAVQHIRGGSSNVVVGLARSTERLGQFHFIGPWVSAPTVIVTRNDSPRIIRDADGLDHARVALQREHFLLDELRSRHPGLKAQEFPTQLAALQALDEGHADAVIGNAYVVSRLIDERFAGRLRVSGVMADGDSEQYFAVPRTQPELARLLEQGFAAVSEAERAEIRQRWLLVRVEPGLSLRDVLPWALPMVLAAVIVIAVLMRTNRRLRSAYAKVDEARGIAEEATAARGRFLAYLAHELRGGVGGIAAGARMILAKPDMASRERMLQAVQKSAEQVVTLLEHTLVSESTLAQGVRIQLAPTEVSSWWDLLMSAHRLRAQEKGLMLVETAPMSPVPLAMDATLIAQVVSNVVGNAIKFTPSGEVQARASWRADSEGCGRLHVEVQDQGPGLSAGDRVRLFEPYAQGEAGRHAGSGAGLGLAISRQIVSAMGGRIEVTDSSAPGCLFVVEIPLEASTAPPS